MLNERPRRRLVLKSQEDLKEVSFLWQAEGKIEKEEEPVVYDPSRPLKLKSKILQEYLEDYEQRKA